MKIDPRLKELVEYMEQFPQLRLVTVERGKHFKLRLLTPSGKRTLVVAYSASDKRATANNRSLLRQWAKATSPH